MTEQNPFIAKSLGASDKQSRTKASNAMKKTEDSRESVNSDSWPRGADGSPMAKITMTAAELVPTGQFANVSIGPVQITAFIDPSRDIQNESYFDTSERAIMAQALNELAEIVEGDVVAAQRNLVMESLREQITS